MVRGGGEKMKSLEEKIINAWYDQDFWEAAEELIEAAGTWKDGSIDGCLVWDIENEELSVVKEAGSTHTPSFIYLFRLSGNEKPDVDAENLYEDLIDFDVEQRLREMFSRV